MILISLLIFQCSQTSLISNCRRPNASSVFSIQFAARSTCRYGSATCYIKIDIERRNIHKNSERQMSMLVLIKYYVLLDCVQSRAETSPLFRKDFREKPQADERSRVKHKKSDSWRTLFKPSRHIARRKETNLQARLVRKCWQTAQKLLFCVHVASHHKNFFWL